MAASAADFTTTQEATGRREAVSAGSSKMNLEVLKSGKNGGEGDALGGVVVVGLDLLELEVYEVLGVEGALVGDLGLDGCGISAVEVEIAREAGDTCRE